MFQARSQKMSKDSVKTSAIDTSVTVKARYRYNDTGIMLVEGHRYRISCDRDANWKDGNMICNADGWHSSQSPRLTQWVVSCAERWRVIPEVNWFTLIGLYANHQRQPFALGVECEFVALYTDTLLLAANDLPLMRWNNSGELLVRIKG